MCEHSGVKLFGALRQAFRIVRAYLNNIDVRIIIIIYRYIQMSPKCLWLSPFCVPGARLRRRESRSFQKMPLLIPTVPVAPSTPSCPANCLSIVGWLERKLIDFPWTWRAQWFKMIQACPVPHLVETETVNTVNAGEELRLCSIA